MLRFFLDDDEIYVPGWVKDLESFRRWSNDEEFPETGQISFLLGEVWIVLTRRPLVTHNQVRSEINGVLSAIVEVGRTGRYFGSGTFLTNLPAAFSHQPDGTFVSGNSFRDGQVRLIEGRHEGCSELEGTPDMVLEVVDLSTVERERVWLRQVYAAAGIREYWLVDARRDPLQFDILRLHGGHYRSTRKHLSWVRSEVFERWFRLTQQAGADGYPEFTLELRADKPA